MIRQMSGFRAWAVQRLTAIYLGLFIPVALLYLLLYPPVDFIDWRQRMADPWIFSAVSLFSLALLLHAWVGMRDVVLDYVKPSSLRLAVLLIIGLFLILTGFWLVAILINAFRMS